MSKFTFSGTAGEVGRMEKISIYDTFELEIYGYIECAFNSKTYNYLNNLIVSEEIGNANFEDFGYNNKDKFKVTDCFINKDIYGCVRAKFSIVFIKKGDIDGGKY